MSKVIVGSTDVTRVTYRDRAGTLTSPDAIAAWVKRPDGTVTQVGVTVTNVSTGIRDVDVVISQQGIWYLEVTATGTIAPLVSEKTICAVAPSVG